MKVFRILILCLTAAAFATAAVAEEGVPKSKGSATVAYWRSNYSLGTANTSSDSTQKFIPIINADFKYEQNIDIAVEFGETKRFKASRDGIAEPDFTVRSEKRMIGLKYKLPDKPGMYASLSWRENKFNIRDYSAPIEFTTIKIKGLRLGVGGKQTFKGKPYSLSADLGYGIMSKANFNSNLFGEWSPTVKTIDGNIKATYSIPKYRYHPVAGYRFENNEIDGEVLNGTSMPGISIKLKGFYVGAEFDI